MTAGGVCSWDALSRRIKRHVVSLKRWTTPSVPKVCPMQALPRHTQCNSVQRGHGAVRLVQAVVRQILRAVVKVTLQEGFVFVNRRLQMHVAPASGFATSWNFLKICTRAAETEILDAPPPAL